MKSLLLLPKHEEIETLKQELTGQLLEYEQCKEVARCLAQEMRFDFFARAPQEVPLDMTYSIKHSVEELFRSYLDAVGKKKQKLPPSRESFSGIVSKKIVSVFSKVVFILRKLKTINEVSYDTLFCQSKSKSDMVATFLAILELVKGKRIDLDENSRKISLVDGGARSWK